MMDKEVRNEVRNTYLHIVYCYLSHYAQIYGFQGFMQLLSDIYVLCLFFFFCHKLDQ